MTARIFKPAKSAMQSGRGNTKEWVLEFEPAERQDQDPLMGWAGSGDTGRQVRLAFASKEDAVAYCKRNNIPCSVQEPRPRAFQPKSYAANFRWDRVR